MFSKACQYGIKASVYIVSQTAMGNRVSLREIAQSIDSPEAFTAKILHQLSKQNILASLKGPTGGFQIPVGKAQTLKVIDIVAAIDGDSIYAGCALGFDYCDENRPCSMHSKFAEIREDLKNMLHDTSLFELANGFDNGLSFLKR